MRYANYSRFGTRKRKSIFFSCLIIFVISGFVLSALLTTFTSTQSDALSGSDFRTARIIDDGIFFNGDAMPASSIQNFLNAKVPTCDTWGTQMRGSQTRAQYGASVGNPAPYTCLKNYRQDTPAMSAESSLCNSISANNRSAAEIIREVGLACGVNPQVLLVLLQKEQSLITDDWPWQNQYTKATGFGCPDTAPCNPSYGGFFYQVYYAARAFKKYARDANSYGYRAYRNNYIQYNPNSACGGSSIYIENQATAGLYVYTPYQPNSAALNNLYGTGDGCSAYGNRNFWRMFNDWFGPTINDSLYYALIKSSSSPAVYLQTSAGKHYVPSWSVLEDWNLDTLTVREVSDSYIDSLPTRSWVGRVLKDDWNNYFIVDNGKLLYVRDPSYLSLWNLNASDAVQSLGLTRKIPSGSWVGRFARDEAQPNGSIWLIDKTQKHLADNAMLYAWRYTPDQLTTVSDSLLASFTTSAAASPYATDGNTSYAIDTGRKISFANPDIKNAYFGSQTPVTFNSLTLSMLPSETNAKQFVVNASNGQWFMLEAGKKHYISNSSLAELWGKTNGTPLVSLSANFLANLPTADNLSYLVQTANPSMYWLIDGTKRYISSSEVADAWIRPSTSLPLYSTESLNHLTRNPDATTSINGWGSPYTYVMDGGVKRYLTTNNAKSAWSASTFVTANQLVNSIPEGSFVNYLIKNNSGQAYLLMNNTLYPIDPAFYDIWGVNNSTPTVNSDQTLARYSTGATLRAFIKIGSTHYVMANGGYKSAIQKFNDTYNPSSLNPVTLPADYFPSTSEATYLIRSTNPSDGSVWLMNQGKKLLLSFEQQVTFGYLSNNIQPTKLSPATISLIPDDQTQASILIQKPNSGIKLLSFGYALGFPDGDTLSNYTSASNPILTVSPSVFDSFTLRKTASRLVIDDRGNYFLIEAGKKRYISSWSKLVPHLSKPLIHLEGTTLYLLPAGLNI